MSNSIKREYDKKSVIEDIIERENIVHQFLNTGYLDRNDAIEKIKSLQYTDVDMAEATKIKQVESGSIDLYYADDNTIISNIQFQIEFLQAKLAKLECDEKGNE